MIPVYSTNGELLLALNQEDLVKSPQKVKAIIKSNLLDCDNILLLNDKYEKIGLCSEELQTTSLPKLAIILTGDQTTLEIEPVRFFVKRTDKKGAVVKCHLLLTVDQLAKTAADLLSIPPDSQQLFFNGEQLLDPSETLLHLGLKNNSVVHIVDTRTLNQEQDKPYTIQLQGAKYLSKTLNYFVTGGMKLGELKEKAAEIYGIPVEKVLVAYCSMLLEDDEVQLLDYSIVPDSLVKILDDRDGIVEKTEKHDSNEHNHSGKSYMHKALHRKSSKDSRRPPPEFILRKTDSVQWFEYRNLSQKKSIGHKEERYMSERKKDESHETRKKIEDLKFDILQAKSEVISQEDKDEGARQQVENIEANRHSNEGVATQGRSSIGCYVSPSPSLNIPNESYRVHSAPRPSLSRLQQFEVDIEDLESNHFKVLINEIDTIGQVKYKLFAVNPDVPPEKQTLIYDGKVLDDSQTVKDIANTQISTLFLMKKEVEEGI